MFGFIKNYLKRVYVAVCAQLAPLFGKVSLDDHDFAQLERILLEADVGVATTHALMREVRKRAHDKSLSGSQLREILRENLNKLLTAQSREPVKSVIVFAGVNGSGKTTTIAKYAYQQQQKGKRVLIAAGDTFRAAATEQLGIWADRVGCAIVTGAPDSDPAAVVFRACERYEKELFDVLLIDTAGRLQTNANLMQELEKIMRVIKKKLGDGVLTTFLTIDGMLGQNSFEQAKLFSKAISIDGIVLTKMDGTGKGGIVFAIAHELHIPVEFMTYGEDISALKIFDPREYIDGLLSWKNL